jgi:hypothetical protein
VREICRTVDQDLYVVSLRPRDVVAMLRVDLRVRISSLARAQEPVMKIHGEEGITASALLRSPKERARVNTRRCGVDYWRTPVSPKRASRLRAFPHRRSPLRVRIGAPELTGQTRWATRPFSPTFWFALGLTEALTPVSGLGANPAATKRGRAQCNSAV